MSDAGAPVCLISRSQQPTAPSPGIKLPSIPKAIDLPSALQAINSLTMIVNLLSGARPQVFLNNLSPHNFFSAQQPFRLDINAGGTPAKAAAAASKAAGPTIRRKVKIVSPDDDNVFIIVERTS